MAQPRYLPHIFSNEAENYIATTAVDSVFLVEVDIRHFHVPDDQPRYKQMCKNMYASISNRVLPKTPPENETGGPSKASKTNQSDGPSASRGKGKKKGPSTTTSKEMESSTSELAPETEPKQKPQPEPKQGLTTNITQGTRQRQATGFVIARRANIIKILTCAHIIEDVYTKDKHEVTLQELNAEFTFDVQCVHQERRLLATPSPLPTSRRLRSLTNAMVVAIDTSKDLLVLQVNADDILLSNSQTCTCEHAPINIALAPPRIREKVMLLGWPPQRSESSTEGCVSYLKRTYDAVCDIDFNVKGYTMRLMEVSGLVCGHGYSGGPLLNNEMEFVGTYHGTIEMKGYSVSLGDIRRFLAQFEVVGNLDLYMYVNFSF